MTLQELLDLKIISEEVTYTAAEVNISIEIEVLKVYTSALVL